MNDLITKTQGLQRSVVNKDGFICLTTEKANGLQYAFYLTHPNGTERVYYSNNLECIFDIPFLPGRYIATFFYKKDKDKQWFKENFIITKSGNLLKPKKTVIGESDGWRIDYYDNHSQITFIVFNGTTTTKKSTPFGLNYLLEKGYNVIACLQDNDQYQSLSFEDFQSCVSPFVDKKDVFLYGSSLGGYCAVYYAGAVNGTAEHVNLI